MALVLKDRVKETSTTTGTGTYTLAGAVTGFQGFSVVGNGNTTWYCATDGTDWEVGIGTWATGGTLARTTILESSNSGSAVNWGAGTRNIFTTIPAERILGDRTLAVFYPTDNEPPSSNYATLGVRNGHPYLAFDTTTQETAIFSGVIPENWDGGDIEVAISVMMASATTGTVGFDAAVERINASGLDLDADSFATAVTVTATTVPGTSGHILTLTATISGASLDGLLPGENYRLRIRRDVANDSAAGDAQVVSVVLRTP